MRVYPGGTARDLWGPGAGGRCFCGVAERACTPHPRTPAPPQRLGRASAHCPRGSGRVQVKPAISATLPGRGAEMSEVRDGARRGAWEGWRLEGDGEGGGEGECGDPWAAQPVPAQLEARKFSPQTHQQESER